jgi:hypothetical protein
MIPFFNEHLCQICTILTRHATYQSFFLQLP